jgi:hypothetical protein
MSTEVKRLFSQLENLLDEEGEVLRSLVKLNTIDARRYDMIQLMNMRIQQDAIVKILMVRGYTMEMIMKEVAL